MNMYFCKNYIEDARNSGYKKSGANTPLTFMLLNSIVTPVRRAGHQQ